MQNNNQIYGLQVIRGVSALLIVLYHYTMRYNEVDYVCHHGLWNLVIGWGCYAVSTFFLISGFLTARNIFNGQSPIKFIKKRINRLYPTFWCAVIITYLVTRLANIGSVEFCDFFANLTMFPMILGKQPVDGVYWTLQYEIIFYIIVSLLLSSRHRISDIIVLAWLIITFVFFCFQDSLPIYLAKAIRVFLIPNYASTFIIGLQTGICVLRKNISLYSIVIILLSFVSLSFWQPSKVVVFFSLSYVLLLNVVSSNKSKLNKKTRYTSWLAFIASISYPLYLIHQKIGFIIISKIIEYTGCVSEIIIIVPIAISIVIAYLIHKFIETRNITILK